MNFDIKQFQVGPVCTNCYFLINHDEKKVIVIDPGDNAKELANKIVELGLEAEAILLTHGHFDHVGGVEGLADRFGVKVYAHKDEEETLKNPNLNLGADMGMAKNPVYHADIFLNDGDEISLAGFKIKVLHTPGHTPGGACFYLEEQGIVFSGDSLFCQSIGRTDFPGGNARQLVSAVKEKLLTLPDETKVFPGHEDRTTIGFEKKYNPFFTNDIDQSK